MSPSCGRRWPWKVLPVQSAEIVKSVPSHESQCFLLLNVLALDGAEAEEELCAVMSVFLTAGFPSVSLKIPTF